MPKELTNRHERKLWKEILGSYSNDYFNLGDVPMLVNYIRAKLLSDQAYENFTTQGHTLDTEKGLIANPAIKIWKDACGTLSVLGTKLRLAPNGRTRPEDGKQSNRKAKDSKVFSPTSDWRDHQRLNG